jgi:hypothetical protein
MVIVPSDVFERIEKEEETTITSRQLEILLLAARGLSEVRPKIRTTHSAKEAPASGGSIFSQSREENL